MIDEQTNGEIEIASKVQDHLTGMFDVMSLGQVLMESEFDLVEEVNMLLDIIKDENLDANVRLRARKDLRDLLKETMQLNGLIGSAKISHEEALPDGSKRVETATTQTLLTKVRHNNEPLTEHNDFTGAIAHSPQEGTPSTDAIAQRLLEKSSRDGDDEVANATGGDGGAGVPRHDDS